MRPRPRIAEHKGRVRCFETSLSSDVHGAAARLLDGQPSGCLEEGRGRSVRCRLLTAGLVPGNPEEPESRAADTFGAEERRHKKSSLHNTHHGPGHLITLMDRLKFVDEWPRMPSPALGHGPEGLPAPCPTLSKSQPQPFSTSEASWAMQGSGGQSRPSATHAPPPGPPHPHSVACIKCPLGCPPFKLPGGVIFHRRNTCTRQEEIPPRP